MDQRTIPDARWINQNLDIRGVAGRLGIVTSRGRFHCWRPENHSNGDADPSVGYWKSGNRLKCFVCDRPATNVIDLVMEVLGIDFVPAVNWIENFDVPKVPARKKHELKDPHRGSVGIAESPIDRLVRSHVYSYLSVPARLLAPVLLAFTDRPKPYAESPRELTMSYKAMMRYSGLRSPNAIRQAIEELTAIDWLQPASCSRNGVVRAVAKYRITPYSELFTQLGNSLAAEEQVAIRYERELAQLRRTERQRQSQKMAHGRQKIN